MDVGARDRVERAEDPPRARRPFHSRVVHVRSPRRGVVVAKVETDRDTDH